MTTAVTFPIPTYNALLGRCLRTSREYALLRNGIVSHRGTADRHRVGIVQLLCEPEDAQRIYDLAAHFYPLAVSQISKQELDLEGAPGTSEHLLQIYEADAGLLDTLANFASAGLIAGQAVVPIATPAHLNALEVRLRGRIDLELARKDDAYIPLDAERALHEFMVDGWPRDDLFNQFVERLLSRARVQARKIRAFGEMVALLWGRGEQAAALRLEELWENLRRAQDFALFCAYPRSGFTRNDVDLLAGVCAAHSRINSCDL
jgi:hypothetical protein